VRLFLLRLLTERRKEKGWRKVGGGGVDGRGLGFEGRSGEVKKRSGWWCGG
jgi:hypothetical protein